MVTPLVGRSLHAVLRSTIWLLLVSVLLLTVIGSTAAKATLRLGGLGPICIRVFDLAEDRNVRTRHDLADRVGNVLRFKLEALQLVRTVRAEPNCIKADQPGFDRQLTMALSIKRQRIKIDNRDWNSVVVSGVSEEGLFQDRDSQPVVIVQQSDVSDVSVVDALVEFVDRTIVAALRR